MSKPRRDESDLAQETPSRAPIGKADTPNVAGSDEQQPEIAEGPVPGGTPSRQGWGSVQPGERTGDPDRSRPPEEVDPPTGPDIPRDAAGDPEAVRRQKKQGGP